MNINIAKKEFKTLLDILKIADWVLHSTKIEKDPETEEYRKLEQKLLSLAREKGLKHLVEYSAKTGEYYQTDEVDSPVMHFIDEYDNEIFWDELSDRLAIRDLFRVEGEEKVKKMKFDERFTKIETLRENYFGEFEKNGIERIKIEE